MAAELRYLTIPRFRGFCRVQLIIVACNGVNGVEQKERETSGFSFKYDFLFTKSSKALYGSKKPRFLEPPQNNQLKQPNLVNGSIHFSSSKLKLIYRRVCFLAECNLVQVGSLLFN